MKDHFRLLVIGGGTAGCAIASKFCNRIPGFVAVVEPSDKHYYQPGLTFVGSGILRLDQVVRDEQSVLPKNVAWFKESVHEFKPTKNCVVLNDGRSLSYEFLVVATGLQLRYDLISGLPLHLLAEEGSGVCSVYDPKYAAKTFEEIRNFSPSSTTLSNALFTAPNTPIKCPGAPQKICYLAEEIWRKVGKREQTRVIYNTPLGKIFGVDKYAKELIKVVEERGIELNIRHNLTKVDVGRRITTFDLLDDNCQSSGQTKEFEYSFLHISPPCSPIQALRDYGEKSYSETNDQNLTDAKGWVAVNQKTLQSIGFENVFAFGDCANTTNSKTAAAISSQFKALKQNLQAVMDGNLPTANYDGYGSCPLIVDSKHVIMAEFNANGPLETFPYDQSKPSRVSFLMKRYFMPFLYWNFLVKGLWNGPATFRKMFQFPKTIVERLTKGGSK